MAPSRDASSPHLERTPLDPDPEEMRRLGYLAVDHIVDHLRTLGEQRVAGPRATAQQLAALVDEPLPQAGLGAEDSLRFYFERVVPHMTRVNHPRFHAFIPCPSSFASTLGELLASGTNPFMGSWLGAATLASLELTVLRWIAEMVGYPQDTAGILTSGGSLANLVALAAARSRHGPGTLSRGRIYVTAEGHASVDKAALILGYPPQAIRRVPTDPRHRLRPEGLARSVQEDRDRDLEPFFVCANAGATNTGAIDPLEEIADFCRRQELWMHVDGAYGGFAALTAQGRALLKGMERADSLTLDPHKWLYSAMGVGCALVRDASALEGAFSTSGHYLKDLPQDEVNFLDRGPELSRPARVLSVWMLVRTVGREALARQVSTDLLLARLAADLIAEDPGFEIVDPPQLSIVAFRHRRKERETEEERAARDTRLMEDTLRDGTLMLSTTLVEGRSTLRFAVMNHRTTETDIRLSVARIRQLASAI